MPCHIDNMNKVLAAASGLFIRFSNMAGQKKEWTKKRYFGGAEDRTQYLVKSYCIRQCK